MPDKQLTHQGVTPTLDPSHQQQVYDVKKVSRNEQATLVTVLVQDKRLRAPATRQRCPFTRPDSPNGGAAQASARPPATC